MRRGPFGAAHGFSILELLIAMGITVVVLGMASVFFAQQTDLQRSVQARNDVQDRMRMATQLVTQDLSLAGAAIRITPDGTIDQAAGTADCAQTGASVRCLKVDHTSATESILSLRYVSSQFPSNQACRDVAYRLDGDILQRRDVACGTTLSDLDFIGLAPDMLGFKVIVVCSTGERVVSFDSGSCSQGYGRSAIVSVAGRSNIPREGASPELVFATAEPNPSNIAEYTRHIEPCTAGRICFGMTQEVLMPNLKDQ